MSKHYFVEFYTLNGIHIGTRSLTSSTHDAARREAQAMLLNSTAEQVTVFANIDSDMFQAYFIDKQTGHTFGPDLDALMKAEAREDPGNPEVGCDGRGNFERDHPGDIPPWMQGQQMELD